MIKILLTEGRSTNAWQDEVASAFAKVTIKYISNSYTGIGKIIKVPFDNNKFTDIAFTRLKNRASLTTKNKDVFLNRVKLLEEFRKHKSYLFFIEKNTGPVFDHATAFYITENGPNEVRSFKNKFVFDRGDIGVELNFNKKKLENIVINGEDPSTSYTELYYEIKKMYLHELNHFVEDFKNETNVNTITKAKQYEVPYVNIPKSIKSFAEYKFDAEELASFSSQVRVLVNKGMSFEQAVDQEVLKSLKNKIGAHFDKNGEDEQLAKKTYSITRLLKYAAYEYCLSRWPTLKTPENLKVFKDLKNRLSKEGII